MDGDEFQGDVARVAQAVRRARGNRHTAARLEGNFAAAQRKHAFTGQDKGGFAGMFMDMPRDHAPCGQLHQQHTGPRMSGLGRQWFDQDVAQLWVGLPRQAIGIEKMGFRHVVLPVSPAYERPRRWAYP